MFPSLYSALQSEGQSLGNANTNFPTSNYAPQDNSQQVGGGYGSQYNQMSQLLGQLGQNNQPTSQIGAVTSSIPGVQAPQISSGSGSNNNNTSSQFAPQLQATAGTNISSLFSPFTPSGTTAPKSITPAINFGSSPQTQAPAAQAPAPVQQQTYTPPPAPVAQAPPITSYGSGGVSLGGSTPAPPSAISYTNPDQGINNNSYMGGLLSGQPNQYMG